MARKKRQLTEKQKDELRERLAKARAARGYDGTASIDPSIRDMDEDSPLHWKKVKQWIKLYDSKISSSRNLRDSKDWKERLEYQSMVAYRDNMKRYLNTGIWSDYTYGENREGRVTPVVVAMAYHPDGSPKRTVGHYYPDMGMKWTRELQDDYERLFPEGHKSEPVYDTEEILDDGRGDGDEE